MHEFWYDYVKPKYNQNAKICCMDTDSFIVHVKTDYIYTDIEFTSNLELYLPVPKRKNKKVIALMKD